MPSLESSIDRLYQGPLDEFVPARTALAKTLTGAEAKRVKALQKPTVVPWAVNQVYWHARSVYDRLLKSGGALRSAQVAALGGRRADIKSAADTHGKAVAAAVAEALRLAASSAVQLNADTLTQTFEVLSLAVTPADPAGRLTKPLQPAGFEALAGVTVKPPVPFRSPREDVRTRQREEAEAERKRKAEIEKAQAALERAQADEADARAEWERRKRDLAAAEQALARLQTQ